MQSVQMFIDAGIPHESYAGLNEISWGAREGKMPNSFDNEYYRTLIEKLGRRTHRLSDRTRRKS
jgi:probable phosphoglycerate mutase